ncbi:aldehyde dehydrogenase family protein [Bradyrhizobium sp. DOA9]|uniref:aldehyde dehydrogenase family protein n=1 Tax=Bradyrhizobium sp. DOA9 TaxID=1126627 RepID=UPI000468F86E|nr:aldehyde dehydrogenase family protein [Bradyrhizobium sp. DOA9]
MTTHVRASAELPVSDATRTFLAGEHTMTIGGRDVVAASGATIPVYDPAAGGTIALVPAGGKAEIDAAVKEARKALDGAWSKLRPADRERLLLRLADALEADGTVLAELETANNGQSIGIAKAIEVGASAEHLRYMAGWATKIYGQTLDVSIAVPPGTRYRAMTRKEPVGVVGAIVPWNFPLSMAIWKIAPALAAGCTIVLKPAEETPLTALRLGRIIREVGFPEGVVNVVTGYGHEAGAALASHPGIDKVAFTGSTEVGKIIGRAAVDNMTRFSLELGGKSPMVMFDDMNPDLIGVAAAIGVYFNQGQVCTCGSRVLVQKGIYDKVAETFVGVANSLKIGSGFDLANQINPLVSKKQQSRVLGLIEKGVAEGARVVAGGAAADGAGFFVKPTVILGAKPDNILVREEIFGPVAALMPFEDMDDAIRQANDTVYGLSASVWSRDINRCFTFADAVKAGTVWVNMHNVVDPNMPFGGFKQSGIGREHGASAVENYMETKSICLAL